MNNIVDDLTVADADVGGNELPPDVMQATVQAHPSDLSDPRFAGYRLEELQIQNFGTYDGPPSVIRLERGSAIFTGRNGVGKTTAIDAFRMLISQEPNFNDATTPEAKKRDRDIRTYYQGVIGKLQRDGRPEYRVLRQYHEKKFMVIVGVFIDAHDRPISAARLVQYDPQGQGNSQRYVLARARLDIARDFPDFATSRAIRDSLAHMGVRVYDTFNAYRIALSGHFKVADMKQAWALFERAIGTKTVDNLTDFMRALILPASTLAKTADELVQSTAALDEAYATVKADEEKLKRLVRIVKEIDSLERSYCKSSEVRRLMTHRKTAGTAVVVRAIRRDLEVQQTAQNATRRNHKAALEKVRRTDDRVTDLELQQRELGGQAVSDWRRDIEDRAKRITTIKSDLEKLATTLSSFGLVAGISFEDSHHSADQWNRIKVALRENVEAIPGRTDELEKDLAQLSADIAALDSAVKTREADLLAAERAKSNLPGRLIEVRERLAETLGVSTSQLPFFGELVRVSPEAARDGWEGSLNRLLGNQARRLLVPERLYAEVVRAIDRRHLGIKLEYDRVDLIPWQDTSHDADQVAGKLDVRRDSDFAGYIRSVLDRRFDHTCFETADGGFRQARRALTKAGQSRDGDRHVKDDRRRVDDRSAYTLGWDTAARVAYLKRDLRKLEADLLKKRQDNTSTRERRDDLMLRANNMQQIGDSMGDFETVDVAKLEEEVKERQQWIEQATSKNPDYVAISKALSAAKAEQRKARNAADELGKSQAVLEDRIEKQQNRLARLHAALRDRVVPCSAWKGYVLLARELDARATIFEVDPEATDVLSDGIWEAIRDRLDADLEAESKVREKNVSTLTRLAGDYLRDFPAETTHLAAMGLTEQESSAARQDWRQRYTDIEARELVRHTERLQQAMTDAIDNGIVNIKTQLEQEKTEIRDTIAGINDTLREVTYDPAHGTKIQFIATDSATKRIVEFTRGLRQVTDDWIGNEDAPIEERYRKTRIFIDKVKDIPENTAWRREVLDTRRWFTFVAQEYKVDDDGSEKIINDYDGASGTSGGQKERLAMTVMAAGLAWRFGMVNPARASTSFRVLMLDEAFKNSHDDTTRALLDLFKAFGFQMVFAMPSKNLAVVSNHIERAFAVDTKARRTIITVHALKKLVLKNHAAAAAMALNMARDAGVDLSDLDFSEIDEDHIGLGDMTADEIVQLAALSENTEDVIG
ncbi:ATP-binding protein [Pelagibius sp.]|uniref:ATP-binding protein n=1 Tax=Pelagibius sp. TaxID=1931238 RepID=UPI003B511767